MLLLDEILDGLLTSLWNFLVARSAKTHAAYLIGTLRIRTHEDFVGPPRRHHLKLCFVINLFCLLVSQFPLASLANSRPVLIPVLVVITKITEGVTVWLQINLSVAIGAGQANVSLVSCIGICSWGAIQARGNLGCVHTKQKM